MRSSDEIKSVFEKHAGMMRTHELYAERVFYKDIQRLILDGVIERIRYGYYQWIDIDKQSEAATVARLFPDAVFCMDTALFYYRYSDRIPPAWHLAVNKHSGKSRFRIDYPFIKPYFVEPSLLGVGMTSGEMDGNSIRIYDKERTICDCLRYSGKMDREVFNNAIRRYVDDPAKDITRLIEYAKRLRVLQKTKMLVGLWL